MSAATGDIGYNDRLEYEELPLGSGSWTTVHQARNITTPKKTASKVDFTHLESADRTKESKPGMGEWSSASFEALYDPANASQGQILADTLTYPQRNFRILLRNSVSGATEETWTFLGHVEEAGLAQIEADSAHLLQGSIAVDGAVAIT
jgi:hypothetical protein